MEENKISVARNSGEYGMIPVTDLMQITHPGYQVYSLGADKSNPDIHLPVFLDYCTCVCERFRHYASQHTERLVTENSLMKVIDIVKELDETDDPEIVFPLRGALLGASSEFLEHCEDMGNCFTTPYTMRKFYQNLGSMVSTLTKRFAGLE
mgnify:FL=1